MPFIGNTPDVNFTSFAKQTITGNGGTSYTLSHAVANENEVEIFVNNVRQEGGSGKAYTVSGTALTMTGNVANTDSFYIIFLGKALQTTVTPDGSVSTAKIADDAVTNAKVADNAGIAGSKLGTGAVLQVKNFQTGAVDTGTTTIPLDDTIPQITEGDEYMTLAITPTSASNKLRIEVAINGASTSADEIAALFVGTTANALNVGSRTSSGNWRQQLNILHYMDSGATSELTFRVRAGGTSGTYTFNGHSSARTYGGVYLSSITIMEIGA